MLLQWRRGIRGLEYCTLYVMIKEIAERVKNSNKFQVSSCEIKPPLHSLSKGGREEIYMEHALRIKELLIPFIEKSKRLLILERHAMQNSLITYEKCNDSEIRDLRTELFSDSKNYAGMFKGLIDEADNLLYALLKEEN